VSIVAAEPLRHELRIAAPPEVVFPYFTDPSRMVEWMGVAALLDPRPGGTFRVEHDDHVVVGEYVEVEPPHRVVFTWPHGSRVEVTLAPDGDGTRLTLLHHDLPEAMREIHARGWAHFLGRLAAARPEAGRRGHA
jgi:uncharacterized protein YndB with AHSA1/START domain